MADQDRPRSRHAEALGALVEQRYPLMRRYAANRLRNRGVPLSSADPEDIVQNALKCVLAVTEPISNVRAYLYTCMDNEIKRAAKRYHQGMGYASLDADVRLADELTVEPVTEVELRHVVHEAMRDLPLQQRRVLLLTRDLGMTQTEAAQVLGSAPGTVGVHAHRAIRALSVTLVGLGTALVALITWAMTAGDREIIPAAGIDSPVGAVTWGLTGVIGVLISVLVGLFSWTTGAGGLRWSKVLRELLKAAEPARPQGNTSASNSSAGTAPPDSTGRSAPQRGPDAPPQ
ncbi:sigma-70 family RNA polymerase sigma factor [Streptomyces sp. Go40/10]|uniref:sigma-70 family RNA polymerase sigma factor n=1 Tax=Streptomyces sp. Go40/10 TaxID=2825844 RepID=UPI001E45D04B|nr:sigma-70 family RNA polymerase sigma factor [Streptomyces sp. Go40/10]UFR07038.1 sigma-70 family RNA polymerase sigma factor [Streptomyces sp. Go40/10]